MQSKIINDHPYMNWLE